MKDEDKIPRGTLAFIVAILTAAFCDILYAATAVHRSELHRDKFRREDAEVGVLRFECDLRTGEMKPYWNVPVTPCVTRSVEAK